jgi:glycine cleavage system H protein
MTATYPDDLLYTNDHEWARIEDRGGLTLATIGISRFAVEQLGDVTQVDLPKHGDLLRQGTTFGSVESVKAVSDVFAPVSGTVVDVNARLAGAPERVNDDPYGEGWMVQIEVKHRDELQRLMTAEGYRAFVREQAH